MATLSALPNEILHQVVNYLPARQRARFSQTSRRYQAIADDSMGWESLYRRDAGSKAHALAPLQEPARTWKQRYSTIAPAVAEPFLTPPAFAQPGDIVTVRRLAQADGMDCPCVVQRCLPMGFLSVKPRAHCVDGVPQTVWVRPGACIDGTQPFCAPAPMECFDRPEDLGPGSEATIREDLPLRFILTSGIRPGLKVTIRRAAVGLTGTPYFMVEEPQEARSIEELVAMHQAELLASSRRHGTSA